MGSEERTGFEHQRKADNAMADDKAKIDWKMLETSADEPTPAAETPSEPVPATTPSPVKSAGKIVFNCSNGHRIVVSATMGGQRGKCSKCGVAVRIPAIGESAAAPSHPARPHAGGAGVETVPAAPSVEEALHVGAGDTHTGDERYGSGSPQQTADHEDLQSKGPTAPQEDAFSGLVTAGDSQVSATEFVGFSSPAAQVNVAPPEPGPGGPEGLANPTAALVARLFQEIAHGGIVEVHITGGSVILPELYEARWSVGSHGLFASRAADNTVTLTAVAWDSIQKIIVRQVDGLPDGMFE